VTPLAVLFSIKNSKNLIFSGCNSGIQCILIFLEDKIQCIMKGSPGTILKLLPCDHEFLETASCRNSGKGCVHKTQSGHTLRKWELRAPACPQIQCIIMV
jgi:hypothetical protein